MTSVPPSMRRVVVQGVGDIVVATVPTPEPAPHEVLVRTLVSGVCGSDVHAARGRHPFVSLPYFPGHEVVGTIVRGDTGQHFAADERVTVEPTMPCWECKQCQSGQENICERLRFFGCVHDQGGMADYFTVDARRLHRVPDSLTLEQAALIEPLATPVHAVRLVSGDAGLVGKSVVILGAGTIGLLVLAAARHRGAKRIVVTDLLESKRMRARRMGADAVVEAGSGDLVAEVRAQLGESADVVFDCVAIQSTVDHAIQLALKGGTVVVVGVPAGDVRIPLPYVQDQQVRIQGSATYLPVDFQEAMEILAAGALDVSEIVTAVFPLVDVAAAFDAAASGAEVKVLLRAESSDPV